MVSEITANVNLQEIEKANAMMEFIETKTLPKGSLLELKVFQEVIKYGTMHNSGR